MKLITGTNDYCCMATAAAMLLDITLEEVFDRVGHDGSDRFFECGARRGFHMQEIMDLCEEEDCFLSPLELAPSLMLGKDADFIWKPERFCKRFMDKTTGKGILMGVTDKVGHSVAMENQKVYDPKGKTWNLADASANDFHPVTFWRAQWLG